MRGILVTHYHSDHISDIGDFNLNSWVAGRPKPLQIIGPEGVDRIVEGLNITYELDRGYRVAHHGAELLDPELGILQARTMEKKSSLMKMDCRSPRSKFLIHRLSLMVIG